jgi:glycosyltransferase involved in cell wall biosynthesis
MRYSILTPTLCRPTLKRLCESIDSQSTDSWEHIVIIDGPFTPEKQAVLDTIKFHPNRIFLRCIEKHPRDFGNMARGIGFDAARGEYICQIDDDDYYADTEVLKTLECVTEVWAIYPVLARGKRCHHNPPGIGMTGSAMFLYRRDTGIKFPQNDHYSADGEVVEMLKSRYKFQSLDRVRELVIYPWANHGMEQKEIDERRERSRRRRVKYAADGMTIDWNDIGELP